MLKSSKTRQFPIILLCFTLGCGAMPRSFTYFRRVLLQREEQQQQTKRNTKLRQSYIFIARGDKQKVLNSFSISTHDNNPANDSHNTFSIQLNTFENLIINLFILSFVLHPSHTFSHEKTSPQISSLPFFQSLDQSISFRMFFFARKARFLRQYYHEIYVSVFLIFLASPKTRTSEKPQIYIYVITKTPDSHTKIYRCIYRYV